MTYIPLAGQVVIFGLAITITLVFGFFALYSVTLEDP